MPAGGGLGADPGGGEVGLRAGTVLAADVDADAAERRFEPGRHRFGRGGAAGVEAEAGEGGAGGRAVSRRARGAGARRGRGQRGAGQRRGGGRFDDDRALAAEDRPRRAALFGRRRAEVDHAAVEPHAGARVPGQAHDPEAGGDGDRAAFEVDGGGGRRLGPLLALPGRRSVPPGAAAARAGSASATRAATESAAPMPRAQPAAFAGCLDRSRGLSGYNCPGAA